MSANNSMRVLQQIKEDIQLQEKKEIPSFYIPNSLIDMVFKRNLLPKVEKLEENSGIYIDNQKLKELKTFHSRNVDVLNLAVKLELAEKYFTINNYYIGLDILGASIDLLKGLLDSNDKFYQERGIINKHISIPVYIYALLQHILINEDKELRTKESQELYLADNYTVDGIKLPFLDTLIELISRAAFISNSDRKHLNHQTYIFDKQVFIANGNAKNELKLFVLLSVDNFIECINLLEGFYSLFEEKDCFYRNSHLGSEVWGDINFVAEPEQIEKPKLEIVKKDPVIETVTQDWDSLLDLSGEEFTVIDNKNPLAGKEKIYKIVRSGIYLSDNSRQKHKKGDYNHVNKTEDDEPSILAKQAFIMKPEEWDVISLVLPKVRRRVFPDFDWHTTYTDLTQEYDSVEDVFNAVSGLRIVRLFKKVDDILDAHGKTKQSAQLKPICYFVPMEYRSIFIQAFKAMDKLAIVCKGHK